MNNYNNFKNCDYFLHVIVARFMD